MLVTWSRTRSLREDRPAERYSVREAPVAGRSIAGLGLGHLEDAVAGRTTCHLIMETMMHKAALGACAR